jgi:hypothetical protein
MPDPEGLLQTFGVLFFMNKPLRYLSYLLRLWQTNDQGQPVWRASLESPGSRERLGFASLDELFKFLETQTLAPNDQDYIPDKPP